MTLKRGVLGNTGQTGRVMVKLLNWAGRNRLAGDHLPGGGLVADTGQSVGRAPGDWTAR